MGSSPPVILKVATPEYKKVVIEASNGKRYFSDLTYLSNVYCFPKTTEDWSKVTQDSGGYALVWVSRFEAHIDQIIGLATKTEDISKSA